MRGRDEHEMLVDASVRLVRDANAPARVYENARGFLEEMGVPAEHAETWTAVGPKRLLLYRKLVRNGLRSTIRKLIPRTAARLGAEYNPWVERYCNAEMPHSHVLRDVVEEFLNWVLPQWAIDASIPRYLPDLARYELFEFHIAIAETETQQSHSSELSLDKRVCFDSSVRLAHFDYAVQRLSDDELDDEIPVEESTWLIGYRDAEYEVVMLELNAFAAAIVEKLLVGKKFGEAVVEAYGGIPPASVLETIAQLIADFAERKIVLGAA